MIPLMLGLAILMAAVATGRSATFFVDAVHGRDEADGTTVQSAWRSLHRASQAQFKPGDQLKLAGGQTHAGQLRLVGVRGTAGAPVTITSYTKSFDVALPAVIDGRGSAAALHLLDCSDVTVTDLEISADGSGGKPVSPTAGAMRCGLLVETTSAGTYQGIELRNLRVSRVSYQDPGYKRPQEDVKTPNGRTPYGYGIRFIVRAAHAPIDGIVIRNCTIERVDHTGLKFTGPSGSIRNVKVEGVRVIDSGGPGIQLSGVVAGRFSRLHVNRSGSEADSRNWGRGSGLWTWNCQNIVIERSEFMNANGPGDSAGVHIDYQCRDVVVQYNLSVNNAGGFCEILGNNFNCAYRYNVSINDGHRVKGRNGAFQEGKTFWLSGYVGKGPGKGPFNSYFYNNTIYVADEIEAKVAVARTAEGVLIANNIFYIKGKSRRVAGDQLRTDQAGSNALRRVVFTNNAFLRAENWPKELGLQDSSPLLGDPAFANPGGLRAADYVPRNLDLVKDRGIRITPLPDDPIGLRLGLDVAVDFFGNPVTGAPDLGAIEMP